MVVKTETCFFSEIRIYPGHGSRLVRRDGRVLTFANHKSVAHYVNRKRAQNLRWTQSWRRNHKKVAAAHLTAKKLVKKTTKVFKTFVGLSLEDLKERKSADYKAATAKKEEKKEKKQYEKKAVKSQVPKFVNKQTKK
eukprot:UN02699